MAEAPRTRVYRGIDPAYVTGQYQQDAKKAVAAGFVPVSESWHEQDGESFLTVVYEDRAAPTTSPPTIVTTAPPPLTKPGFRDRPLWQRLAIVVVGFLVVIVVAAVLRSPTPATQTTQGPPTAQSPGAAQPREGGTLAVGLGEPVRITEGGEESLLITVERAAHHASFPGEFGADEPASGNVFYTFFVKYEGLGAGGNYNPFDWQVFAGNQAARNAFVLNGPEPALSSGSLPNGRTVSGWLVYEGPADPGNVTLSYEGNVFNDEPVFEVTVPCC